MKTEMTFKDFCHQTRFFWYGYLGAMIIQAPFMFSLKWFTGQLFGLYILTVILATIYVFMRSNNR